MPKIDTEAKGNLLPLKTFRKRPYIHLEKTAVRNKTSRSACLLGMRYRDTFTSATFHRMKTNEPMLLGSLIPDNKA